MNQSAFSTFSRQSLRTQDRILGLLGHAELCHALDRDLDGLARRRVASHSRLAIDQHQLAQAGQGEGVLGVLVGERSDELQNICGGLLGDTGLVGDLGSDLGLARRFC